ncbi:MAG: carboxypeptidase-like regulatory domain-containing protein, partial [Bacteroidales bacterium]|nr:carboxypeptidase-like regulatory domain-containing protein [Bacteroidales bacterium]
MHKPTFFLVFLILFPVLYLCSQSSYTISGRVVDSKTSEPLAFVHIVINQSNYGGTTDIDGKFRFRYFQPIRSLRLSYVGYDQLVYPIGSKTQNLVIYLERKEIELQEV